MFYPHLFTSKVQRQTNPRITHSKLQRYTLSVFIFYIHIYLIYRLTYKEILFKESSPNTLFRNFAISVQIFLLEL